MYCSTTELDPAPTLISHYKSYIKVTLLSKYRYPRASCVGMRLSSFVEPYLGLKGSNFLIMCLVET